ncbi:response regulator [Natronosalvus halobius]|uniref:response regulator n=1 Tax=Natronosalvus halobius TaxID=2953746 RepID=UPI00209EC22B|nr:response regulator [Natronosalvus halobius]USZ73463.1 response regulator [Natronosalvus halobius]
MISVSENKSIPDILLVEDNPGDVRLTQEALRDAKFDARLHIALDGIEALNFLKDGESPCPDLILLDLNLPRKDGFDVMEEIRNDPDLTHLPILVLTSSTAKEDILSSYERYVNAYLTKPDDPGSFVELVQIVEEFWIGNVRLPSCS